jgi:hypothetical protein
MLQMELNKKDYLDQNEFFSAKFNGKNQEKYLSRLKSSTF